MKADVVRGQNILQIRQVLSFVAAKGKGNPLPMSPMPPHIHRDPTFGQVIPHHPQETLVQIEDGRTVGWPPFGGVELQGPFILLGKIPLLPQMPVDPQRHIVPAGDIIGIGHLGWWDGRENLVVGPAEAIVQRADQNVIGQGMAGHLLKQVQGPYRGQGKGGHRCGQEVPFPHLRSRDDFPFPLLQAVNRNGVVCGDLDLPPHPGL